MKTYTQEELEEAISVVRGLVPEQMDDSYFDGWANALTELEIHLNFDEEEI